VRGLGPITALFVSIAGAVGVGWQYWVFYEPGHVPLPENLWFAGIPPGVSAYIIGGIATLIPMLGYSILITALPRSGGGYVAISRIISPFAGFLAAWFEFCFVGIFLGINAVAPFELGFGSIGVGLGITSPTPFNDIGYLAGALVLLVVFVLIFYLGVRFIAYAFQLLVWVPLALGVYVLFLLATAILNPAILQNGISLVALEHGMTGVTAESYVKGALAQGLDGANIGNYWTAVSASMLGAYLAFTGYTAATFAAGEVENPDKNFPRVLLLAPIIIVIMYVTMATFGAYAAASVGQTTLPNGDRWSFYEAWSYLTHGGGSLQQAGVPGVRALIPTLASLVGAGLGLRSLNVVIFAFSILWVVNEIPAFLLVGSRIIFAMSFDRVLPSFLSKVSGRSNSPVYATILVAMFAIFGALSETCIVCNGGSWNPGGTLGDVLNALFVDGFYYVDIMDAAFLALFSLAVVLFPFRLRKQFETARFKPGGKLGVFAIGVAGLVGNIIIAWMILASPQDAYNILAPTSDNWYTIGFTILLSVIGSLIYAYYRYGPARRKVDFSAIFSEIPPE